MKKPLADISRPPPPTKSKRGRTLRPKINLIPDDEDEEAVIHTGPRVFESWCPEVSWFFSISFVCKHN